MKCNLWSCSMHRMLLCPHSSWENDMCYPSMPAGPPVRCKAAEFIETSLKLLSEFVVFGILPKWFRSLSNWQKDPFECRVNVLEFWAQLPCQYAGLQATPTRCYCSSGGRIAEGKLLLDGEGRLNTALLAEAKNWRYKMPLRYNWYTPTWRRDPPALIDRRHLRQSILWLYRLSASIISKFSLCPTFSDPCQP